MVHIDTTKLIEVLVENTKQIVELKNQIKNSAPTDTQKTLSVMMPFLAAIIGSLGGWFIAKYSNNKQTEKDLLLIEIKEKKEIETLHRKLFAEMYGLKNRILDEMYLMNLNFLEAKCGQALVAIAPNEEGKNYNNSEIAKYEARFHIGRDKVVELNNKVTNVIGEYMYLKPNSPVSEFLREYLKTPYQYKITKDYSGCNTRALVLENRKIQVKDTSDYVHKVIAPQLGAIAELMSQKK